jgi:eukaryotic-like serine/threonine-protein kinase
MSECPELGVLEQGGGRDHARGCVSCRVVVDLLDERKRGEAKRDRADECMKFELLLAARQQATLAGGAGELLDAHLRACQACREVAVSAAPPDARAAARLPAVSTSAYAFGRELGRGGMGRILEADDLRIGRRVAVKELLAGSPSLAARFEREARVTARLQHPGIVPIYEIGAWPDGTPFYTMRIVEGRTLRDAIRERASLDRRLELVPALLAAADAVAFAHGAKIIHRDLTPTNILVGAHGDTVVIDWGLAKDLADPGESIADGPYRDHAVAAGLTSAGAVIGTAAYMPPEQAAGDAVDERADVYALGAVLYHLLAGVAPYAGTRSEDVVDAVRAGPPPAIATLARGAPPDLISIAMKAMARDRADRYRTAGELADELRRFQTGRLVEAHHYSTGERTGRWLRAHRVLVIASAAAVVALGAAGTWGIVGIAGERDHAQHERSLADAARQRALAQNAALMTEQGRQELLAGNTTRALAWLDAAYQAGDTSEELRFMLGTALGRVESVERTFRCSAQSVQFSDDGTLGLAACDYGLEVVRVADWSTVRSIETTSDGAVLSHDRRRIANKTWATLEIWDVASGALVAGVRAHGGFIRNIAFTPDDRWIVTSGDDAKVKVWNAASGALVRELTAGSGAMNTVRSLLTPDGKTLITMTADGRRQLWELATGRLVRTVQLPVQSLEGGVSPDGARVLECGTDGTVRSWELATGAIAMTLEAHAHGAFTCAFSRDGTKLLSTGFDATAKVWDARTGRLLATLVHPGITVKGAFSPDGERIATVGGDGTLRLWHAATGSLLASIDDPFGLDQQVVFSPDGRRLVTVREPNTLVVWKDLGGELAPRALPAGTTAAGASPTLQQLALEDAAGAVTIADATTLAARAHEPLREPFAWSYDATRLAAAAARGGIVVIDLASGHTLLHVDGHADQLALDEHGQRLLVASASSEVWDVDRRERVLALGKRADKDSLARSGQLVVAWSDPKRVELWNIAQRRVQATLALDNDTLGPVGFDGDAGTLVLAERAASPDVPVPSGVPPVARLTGYDAATGARRYTVEGSFYTWFDPARERFATWGVNKRIELRRARDGVVLSSFSPGPSFFSAGEPLPGGAFVLAEDGASRDLRAAGDGRLLARLVPTRLGPTWTQDSFQMGADDHYTARDGRTIVLGGPHPIVWTLPRETRSPAEVDRIVRAHTRWKISDGHLLPLDATVRGRVLRHGRPVAHAQVGVQVEAAATWLRTLTDADGRYELPAMRWGTFTVIAMAPDRDAKGIHALEVASEQLTADLELDEEATISGTVVDERGAPVAGVQLRASRNDDSAMGATSAADGTFTIRALHEGPTDVVARRGYEGHASTVLRSNSDHVAGLRVTVTSHR